MSTGLGRAIDAIKGKPQRARSDVVAHEHMHEGLHQAACQRDDGLLGEDRLDEITQAVIDRRGDDGDERLIEAAERLIDPPKKRGRETRGKGRARLVEERAHGFEAEPAQRR